MEVLDFDLTAGFAECSRKDFSESAGPVTSSCASDGDALRAGGEVRVVREVVDQLTGAGRCEDDLLDAGVQSVEVEDVAGGCRVAEPLADVLDTVSGGRDGGAVRTGGQVQVAERDQTDRVQGCLLKGGNVRSAAPGREGRVRRSGVVLLGGGVGDHEELVGAQVHHDLSIRAVVAARGRTRA